MAEEDATVSPNDIQMDVINGFDSPQPARDAPRSMSTASLLSSYSGPDSPGSNISAATRFTPFNRTIALLQRDKAYGYQEAFFWAVEHGKIFDAWEGANQKEKRIVTMLSEKPSLLRSVRDVDGTPPLWKQMRIHDAKGKPAISSGRKGDNALHLAARVGSQETVRFLLTHGCSPHHRNEDGLLPIHVAVQRFAWAFHSDQQKPVEDIGEEKENDTQMLFSCFGLWKVTQHADDSSLSDKVDELVSLLMGVTPAALVRSMFIPHFQLIFDGAVPELQLDLFRERLLDVLGGEFGGLSPRFEVLYMATQPELGATIVQISPVPSAKGQMFDVARCVEALQRKIDTGSFRMEFAFHDDEFTMALVALKKPVNYMKPPLRILDMLEKHPTTQTGKKALMQGCVLAALDKMREESPGKPGFEKFFYQILEADGSGNAPSHPDFRASEKSVLQRIAKSNNKAVVAHDVVRMLLKRKWDRFGRFIFRITFGIYLLYAFCVSFAFFHAAENADDVLNYSSAGAQFRAFCEIVIGIQTVWLLYRNVQIVRRHSPRYYIQEAWHTYDLITVLFFVVLIVLRLLEDDAQWDVMAFVYFLTIMKVFKYGGSFRAFGTLAVAMTKIMSTDVINFSNIFVVFFFSFIGAIHILLASDDQSRSRDISTFPNLMLSGFRTLAEGGPVIEFEESGTGFRDIGGTFASFLLLAFVFITVLVLMNVLIALMTDTYARVQVETHRQLDLNRAKTIARMEATSLMFKNLRRRFYKAIKEYEDPKGILARWTEPNQLKRSLETRIDTLTELTNSNTLALSQLQDGLVQLQKTIDTITRSSFRDNAAKDLQTFLQEVIANPSAPRFGTVEPLRRRAQIRSCFEIFDKNRTGVLPTEDVYHVLVNLGPGMEPREAQRVLATIDPLSTGHFDFEAFCSLD
eukprot:m.202644 g.202644  ORF g.202644 m.202644 type:complete len:916 (+) comp25986_c0_seq1:47-2794(+)